jgi:hypothetical protein
VKYTGPFIKWAVQLAREYRSRPTPTERSSRGLASFTVRDRFLNRAWFKASIACSAPSTISTNANPRLLPVSRSEQMVALSTRPYRVNISRNSSAVASNGRFPTYSFFKMYSPFGPEPGKEGRRADVAVAGLVPLAD